MSIYSRLTRMEDRFGIGKRTRYVVYRPVVPSEEMKPAKDGHYYIIFTDGEGRRVDPCSKEGEEVLQGAALGN